MSSVPTPASLYSEELKMLRSTGTWFAILGALLIILGFAALSHALIATAASVAFLGGLLIAAGIVHIASAIAGRSWGGFLPHLLAGILDLIVGVLMLEHPAQGAAGLTLMLAVAFLAGGLLRLVAAIIVRFPGWPWALLSGLAAFALGVMIWRQWPESSLKFIGIFVGVNLVMCGMTWLMLGLAARQVKV